MSLREDLESLTTTGWRDSLQFMLKLARIKAASYRKADMVDALEKYLSNEQNIIGIWNRLNSFEKEIIEEFIRGEGSFEYSEIKQIAEKYNKKLSSYYFSYFVDVFDENSSARLFFIHRTIPKPIWDILKRFVKPLERKYTPIEKLSQEDVEAEIIIRESFEKDFIGVIKLVNSTKLRTTKGSGLPTKAAVVKINEVLKNKDILTSDLDDIKDIRVIEQTTRLYGISKLLIAAGIIEEQDGILVLGPEAEEFLKSKQVDKCEMLLKSYIESDIIYELDRIREIKIRTNWRHNLKSCREKIFKYLEECPIDKWVDMQEILKFVKKDNRKFLTGIVGEIYSYNDYERFYGSRNHSWYQIEGRFIEIMFLEYLSSIGIVDTAVIENEDEYGNILYFTVNYFRLTHLGAYVLGVTNNYTSNEKVESSGFIVQPNYEIVVSQGSMEDLHSIFFDRFAEKISEGAVNVYKITFKSIINALDNGISVKEIIDYIKEYSSKEISENVLLTLEGWERESKRIKIRTVTIVETSDKYLLEELKSYKTINNSILKELPYVLEIDGKSANKVKREIEKKNHFCIIEDK